MNYDNQFTANPLGVARLYPFSLGNGPAGYQGLIHRPEEWDQDGYSHEHRLQGDTAGPIHGHPLSGLTTFNWGSVNPPMGGVRRVSLDLWTIAPPLTHAISKRRHSLELSFDPAVGGFDAYFLPWDQTGGAIYMQLGDDADYFFTADLTGCSVMVSGNPDAPTVYHCGIGNWATSIYVLSDQTRSYNHPVPTGTMSIEIWEDLVAHLNEDTLPATRIDTTDYMNDHTPGKPLTTAGSRRIQKELRWKKLDPNAHARPWGSVFGLRDTNTDTWSFYLQQNVTLDYQKPRAAPTSKARPLVVSKFYPVVQNYAHLWPKL